MVRKTMTYWEVCVVTGDSQVPSMGRVRLACAGLVSLKCDEVPVTG